jgi:phosphate starvation-inducible membrane PsiE
MFVMTLYIADFASSTYAIQDLLLFFVWLGVVVLVISLFLVGDKK